MKFLDQIADIIHPSALYHGNRQFDCCADRRKKVVEKDIAELHFDHQVWTDPVLPDRREHHRICNADGILPIAADGVVWTGNHCFFDFWIRDSIRGSSLCYRLSDKVMQRRHTSEMVGGFSWNLPVLLFL